MPMQDTGMGFIGGYLNAGQTMADTANTQSLIREREIMNQARQFALKQNMATQSAMQSAAAEEAKLRSGSMATMTPDQLAASEDTDQPDTPTLPPTASSEAPKASDLAMREYERETRLARKIAAEGGSPTVQEAASQRAQAALFKATEERDKERKDAIDKFTRINQTLTAAVDADTLNNTAIPQAKAMFGNDAVTKMLKMSGMEQNPDGTYPWSPRNVKIVQTLADETLSALDRRKREDAAADRERKLEEAKSRIEAREERTAQAKRDEQLRREIAEGRSERDKDKAEAKKQADGTKAERFQQTLLDRDPVYQKFTQYQNGFDLARNAITTLQTKEGYENFNPSDARGLATTFQNMSEGFRNRAGGKYAMQDEERFNGLYQKFDKWVRSFGKGTPTFSESTARDVANTVTEMYDIANKNVSIAVLEAKERVSKAHGDPEMIRSKGDLGRMFKIGQARILDPEGKVIPNANVIPDGGFLEIGRTGQQTVRFKHKEAE